MEKGGVIRIWSVKVEVKSLLMETLMIIYLPSGSVMVVLINMDTPLCLELYVAENNWLYLDDFNF